MWLPLVHPLLGTWPATQACVLTRNWTSNPLVCNPCSIHWATSARADDKNYYTEEWILEWCPWKTEGSWETKSCVWMYNICLYHKWQYFKSMVTDRLMNSDEIIMTYQKKKWVFALGITVIFRKTWELNVKNNSQEKKQKQTGVSKNVR